MDSNQVTATVTGGHDHEDEDHGVKMRERGSYSQTLEMPSQHVNIKMITFFLPPHRRCASCTAVGFHRFMAAGTNGRFKPKVPVPQDQYSHVDRPVFRIRAVAMKSCSQNNYKTWDFTGSSNPMRIGLHLHFHSHVLGEKT